MLARRRSSIRTRCWVLLGESYISATDASLLIWLLRLLLLQLSLLRLSSKLLSLLLALTGAGTSAGVLLRVSARGLLLCTLLSTAASVAVTVVVASAPRAGSMHKGPGATSKLAGGLLLPLLPASCIAYTTPCHTPASGRWPMCSNSSLATRTAAYTATIGA